MDEYTTVNIKMIKSMALVNLAGLMAESTQVNGLMESNMEKAPI